MKNTQWILSLIVIGCSGEKFTADLSNQYNNNDSGSSVQPSKSPNKTNSLNQNDAGKQYIDATFDSARDVNQNISFDAESDGMFDAAKLFDASQDISSDDARDAKLFDVSQDISLDDPDVADAGVPKDASTEEGVDVYTPPIINRSCRDLVCSDCCDSLIVPSGSFLMGNGEAKEGGEYPEHEVFIDSFELDKYEVTVGRFRNFVEAYESWQPEEGDGENIEGTGWQNEWNDFLPQTKGELVADLQCNSSYHTWTNSPGANEKKPITCVNWYEALAFCIWDGKRLPTEAEWEYVATGGNANRLYPWGSAEPTCNLANYLSDGCGDVLNNVGNETGKARWGHYNIAGSVREWVFDWYDADWYSNPQASGSNVVNLNPDSERVNRGGSYLNSVFGLRTTWRVPREPTIRWWNIGIRCAR